MSEIIANNSPESVPEVEARDTARERQEADYHARATKIERLKTKLSEHRRLDNFGNILIGTGLSSEAYALFVNDRHWLAAGAGVVALAAGARLVVSSGREIKKDMINLEQEVKSAAHLEMAMWQPGDENQLQSDS